MLLYIKKSKEIIVFLTISTSFFIGCDEKKDNQQSQYKEIYYEEDNMLCRQEAENIVTCLYVVE